MPKQAPVHVLIVGAGAIGALWDTPEETTIRTHAHAVTTHPGFILAGFIEPDPARAAAATARWGGQAWECFETALNHWHGQDDCLYILPVIASPDVTHGPLLRFLLRNVWPKVCGVVVEKPFASSVEDARTLAEEMRVAQLPLWVNYPRAFLQPYVDLKDFCKTLGPWRQGTLRYGKGLWHNGSHGLQLWQMLTGVQGPAQYDVTFSRLDRFEDWLEGDRDPTLSGRLMMAAKGCGEPRWLMLDPVPADGGVTVFELDLLFQGGRVQILDNGQQLVQWRVGSQPLSPQHQYFVREVETSVDLLQAMAGVYQHIRKGLSGDAGMLSELELWCTLTEWLSTISSSPHAIRLPLRTPSSMGNPARIT